MDERPPIPETPPLPPPPPPATSLAARFLNVFASPGEVFEEVKNSVASTSNWLVPALLSAAVGVVAVIILFSQPAFVQQAREQWASGYEGMVKAGKMSQADADKAVAILEKFAPPAGCAAAVAVSFARVFWWAFVLWLLGRLFLKTKFSYLKSVEVAGLATMISVLGGIVALLLSINFGKLSGANLDLLLGGSDPKSKLHPLLTVLDVFSFWLVGVMSAGLARLAGVRFAKAFVLVAGYWLLLQFVLLSLGALAAGLMHAAK
jgi:hypothetical protein